MELDSPIVLLGLPMFIGFGVCILYLLFGSRPSTRKRSLDEQQKARFRGIVAVVLGATLGLTGFALLIVWSNPPPKVRPAAAAQSLARTSGRDPRGIYVNPAGLCYHYGYCKWLDKGAVPMTLHDAEDRSLKPCHECIPPEY